MVKIQQKTYLDHMISEADYEYLKRCLLRMNGTLTIFLSVSWRQPASGSAR